MAAGGNPQKVKLGPGRLSYAPLGTAEPASATALLPSAWQPIGYTENGTEIQLALTSEDIDVAEEPDPIDSVNTKRTTVLNVEMAESTKRRLLLALGNPTAADDSTPFEFPDLDTIVGAMYVWDSTLADTPAADNIRWLFRKGKGSGTITSVRRKAPAKRTITTQINCVKPDATNRSVKVFPGPNGEV